MEVLQHFPAPVRAVILDKDGTIHDTERVFFRAWHMAAEIFHVPDIEATARACTGMTEQDMSSLWAKKYPDIDFWPYVRKRNEIYFELVSQNVPHREGAMELLTGLKALGYRLGLATSSKTANGTDQMIRSGMAGLFDAMVFGDMVEKGKPDPDIFLKAADLLGVDPAECVGVEDSVNGIRAIHAAGMRAIMVPDILEPTPEIRPYLWAICPHIPDILKVLDGAGM